MTYALAFLLLGWIIFGTLFYVSIVDYAVNPWKRIIARIVAGPLVWVGFTLLPIIVWLDNAYVKFCEWLRKP